MCVKCESVSSKPWGPWEGCVRFKKLANFATDGQHLSEPTHKGHAVTVSAELLHGGKMTGLKAMEGPVGKEDILEALTTRDSLGLGPLEIKLLRVTIST